MTFMTWLGEVRVGPAGHPALLANVADDALITEAMRLQREMPLEERDVWRAFCSADPDRGLRALRIEADVGNWNVEAWLSLVWEASEKEEVEFQFELADLLIEMPDAALGELLSTATSWLRRRRETYRTRSAGWTSVLSTLGQICRASTYGTGGRRQSSAMTTIWLRGPSMSRAASLRGYCSTSSWLTNPRLAAGSVWN